MELPRAGIEYAHWTVTGAPDGLPLHVSVDDGTTWHPLTRTGDTATALLAGPDAISPPPEAITLAQGRTGVTIRAVDNPETIIRTAGTITIY